jgi:hypothetical protein
VRGADEEGADGDQATGYARGGAAAGLRISSGGRTTGGKRRQSRPTGGCELATGSGIDPVVGHETAPAAEDAGIDLASAR